MAPLGYIGSALVMGLVLLGTFLALARVTERPVPFARQESGGLWDAMTGPTGWILGFVLLVALAIGGGVAFVGGVGGVDEGTATLSLIALLLAGLFGYVLLGTYHMARSRGLPSSHAAGASLWAAGSVLLLGIVVKLIAT